MSKDPKWLAKARTYLGQTELKGPQHNKTIVEFFADVGHSWVKDDETAWCAAFLGAVLERSGYRSSRQLTARSYLQWGQELKEPRKGCIAVFKRGTNNWQGHVAFYVSESERFVTVIGGNQKDTVSLMKISKSRLLGYRWPVEGKPSQEKTPIMIFIGVAIAAAAFVISRILSD